MRICILSQVEHNFALSLLRQHRQPHTGTGMLRLEFQSPFEAGPGPIVTALFQVAYCLSCPASALFFCWAMRPGAIGDILKLSSAPF
jgi:hypothetical protein